MQNRYCGKLVSLLGGAEMTTTYSYKLAIDLLKRFLNEAVEAGPFPALPEGDDILPVPDAFRFGLGKRTVIMVEGPHALVIPFRGPLEGAKVSCSDEHVIYWSIRIRAWV